MASPSEEPVSETKDHTVSFREANSQALLFGILPALPFILAHLLLWGSIGFADQLFDHAPFLVIAIVGIVIHEGLHGIGFLLANTTREDVSFGVKWKTLTPYAHCSRALPVNQYRLACALPGVLMGFLPALVGVLANIPFLTVWGAVFILVAGGDFLILWLIRDLPPEAYVIDHPDRVGCQSISGPPPESA